MNQRETSIWPQLEPWCILTHILHNLWMVLLSGLIGVLVAGIVLQTCFHTRYGARMTYVVTARASTSASTNLSAADSVCATFSELLGSEFIHRTITAAAGLESFSGTINAVNGDGTNLITISVEADTAREAFLISDALASNTDTLMRYIYNGAVLSRLNAPVFYTIPAISGNPGRIRMMAGLLCAAAMVLLLVYDLLRQDTLQTAQAAQDKLDARMLLAIGHERQPRSQSLRARAAAMAREKRLDLPALLRAVRAQYFGSPDRHLLLLTEPTVSFAFTESIHRLRSLAEQQYAECGSNMFLVTSVLENEGKSVVAENLALSLAQKHKSVLIVDCDFRKPSRFRSRRGNTATKQIRCGDVSLVVAYNKATNVHMLYTGTLLKNPSEFLSSAAFLDMLTRVRDDFSYVIVDTPPLELFSDAENLADLDASTLMVIRQNNVPAPVINDVIDTLKAHNARFMGYVFNDVHMLLPALFHPESSDYGYHSYGKYGRYGSYEKYAAAPQEPEQPPASRRLTTARATGAKKADAGKASASRKEDAHNG